MIKLTDIKLRYGKRLALDIPSAEFSRGRRYALIGANGSGKTTLIRVLSGALSPNEGSVERSGRIGYMPQSPYAFDISVLKNVMMAGGDEASAREALELTGLSSLADARGSRLSGGERQRMALARLISVRWDALLLDEPTSATDIAGTDAVEDAIAGYAERTGCLLVFATHSPAEAARLADEVIMLADGRAVETGEASRVLSAPENELTRRFLAHWRI